MQKILVIFLTILLAGCSFFQVRKPIIEQGNIITEQQVARLHAGMSVGEIIAIMGTPVVVNLFTPDRIEYVYTYKIRTSTPIIKRVSLLIQYGRLREIHTIS